MFALESAAAWAAESLVDLGYEVFGESTDADPDASCEVFGVIEVSTQTPLLVTVASTPDFARHVAAKYLETSAAEVSAQEATDAFMELTNTLGGHFKATLNDVLSLGLPQVLELDEWTARASTATPQLRLKLNCEGHAIFLLVHKCGS